MQQHVPPWPLLLLLLLFLFTLPYAGAAAKDDEAQALLQFKSTLSSVDPKAFQNWTGDNGGPCGSSTWHGVVCNSTTLRVSALQLENMSLSGVLNLPVLAALPKLRSLSLRNNSFAGAIPDLTQLPALKNVYLSLNSFSGEIPDDMFRPMLGLKTLHLYANNFSGRIPGSLTAPAKLTDLRLDANGFEGGIPDLRQPGLLRVNVSFNKLEGKIPEGLSKMNPSLFEGNKNLCGPPLKVACPTLTKKKRSSARLIAIILIPVVGLLAITGVAIVLFRRQKRQSISSNHYQSNKTKAIHHFEPNNMEMGIAELNDGETTANALSKDKGKLSFVIMDRRDTFELNDLLRASAEVLGSGNFGSSYKAVLLNGPTVVVKRFREMNAVGKEEFQEHMRRIGRLSHPNLLPLVAYYYRKEDKLLVTDYIPNGSLAHMLHGNRGSKTPSPLVWPLRLKVIKGVARALAYLHEELPDLPVPHGHLKSSNVLLGSSFEPLLTDYSLVPVTSKAVAAEVTVAYKSPECTRHGKPSKKSDVWSLGILILEVLTGKFPANNLRQGRAGTDLAGWVNSVVREEWTGEVFDKNMKGTKNCEGEMLKLLQVGMACCEIDVNKRLPLEAAVDKIEGLKERDSDADFSSFMSEGEAYSSRGLTEDEVSFSMTN